ncbi:MAG: NAD(P)H-dependent oxidoreductase [Actinobacteria bacterium]|nr:NAD(P)H-dependent oxidoreductase [Actinomycetota bacterium]
MRVIGIAGSLRAGSYNAKLLDAAAQALPADADYRRWAGLADVPFYNADRDEPGLIPVAAEELRAVVAGADGLLFATPEYNGSIPGGLKNAVDWLSRPFGASALSGKTVAVIGAGTGRFGGVWAQAELRKALGIAGARVVDAEFALPGAAEAFDADGQLSDFGRAEELTDVVAAFVGEVRVSAPESGPRVGAVVS